MDEGWPSQDYIVSFDIEGAQMPACRNDLEEMERGKNETTAKTFLALCVRLLWEESTKAAEH